jgi:hypothetical protein
MAITPTTWNPDDKNAEITLSGGNLVAINTNTLNRSVRSIFSASTGKYYWEITLSYDIEGSSGTADVQIGVATASASLSSPVSSNYGWEYGLATGHYYNGYKEHNESHSLWGDEIVNTDIIGIALDADNGKLFFSRNGVWQEGCDPVLGTGAPFEDITGPTFAIISLRQSWVNNISTVNFGATDFAYTVPTGFTAGFGAEAIPFIARITMIR